MGISVILLPARSVLSQFFSSRSTDRRDMIKGEDWVMLDDDAENGSVELDSILATALANLTQCGFFDRDLCCLHLNKNGGTYSQLHISCRSSHRGLKLEAQP